MSDTIICQPGLHLDAVVNPSSNSTDTFLNVSKEHEGLQPLGDGLPDGEVMKNNKDGCCGCCYDEDDEFSFLSLCACLAWICSTLTECIQCGCLDCVKCLGDVCTDCDCGSD